MMKNLNTNGSCYKITDRRLRSKKKFPHLPSYLQPHSLLQNVSCLNIIHVDGSVLRGDIFVKENNNNKIKEQELGVTVIVKHYSANNNNKKKKLIIINSKG